MTARVAILGATGYGGGELCRILARHPGVDIGWATSRSKAGTPLHSVHHNLYGITDLEFSTPSSQELIDGADLIIGALPHGASAEVLAPFVVAGKRVVDLSGDYRLRDMDAYRVWYKREHPHPELVPGAVYGCPELNADAIRTANLVASPGCFATSTNLALLPAASRGWLSGRPNVVAMTASSGSGADPRPGTHHPLRAQMMRAYKVLAHQHAPEVVQCAGDAGSALDGINFTPVSAPLVRGILAVVTAPLSKALSTEEVEAAYAETFAEAPFVKVLTHREPDCAPIAATNYAEVRARVTADGQLHAMCAIDNLVKGGAGQAIQAMNLMLGLDQSTGLDWPGTWP